MSTMMDNFEKLVAQAPDRRPGPTPEQLANKKLAADAAKRRESHAMLIFAVG